jgi:hypothetical protein
VREEELIDIA